MTMPLISDSSISMILTALNSMKHEFGANVTLTMMIDKAKTEVQTYSRAIVGSK